MSKAAEIVKEGGVPKRLEEAATEVSEQCKAGWALLEDESLPDKDRETLQFKAENHGLHAYRFEALSDGSTLAIYANDPEGKIKLKAFDTHEEASAWSPRDERE